MPAAPIARMICDSKTSSPPSEMATVSPEKKTVRPAVPTVRPMAVSISSSVSSLGGPPLGDGAQLLPGAGDDEQAVVDAEGQPQQGHDVDDGRVQVDGVGEDVERGQAAADGRDGAGDRHTGGNEPTEDDDHQGEAQRQGDALAGAQVHLDLVGDLGEEQLAATHRPGRSAQRVPERPVCLHNLRFDALGRVVVEAAVKGRDDQEPAGVAVLVAEQRGGARVGQSRGKHKRVHAGGYPVDRGDLRSRLCGSLGDRGGAHVDVAHLEHDGLRLRPGGLR